MPIYQGKARYPVHEVILHCAAIREGQFDGFTPFAAFQTVHRWHKMQGWSGFGYHGLIMPDGTFYAGRPFDQIGAHVKGRNQGTIGILLIESHQIKQMGQFEDFYTAAQARSLKAVIAGLPHIKQVSGHNDYAPKLCPGFRVESSDWLSPPNRLGGFPVTGDNFRTIISGA